MSIQSIQKTDLRRTILDTSRHMLVTEGFNRLSMRKIANEVGCSATSIYLYFANKDALLHALIDEGFEIVYGIINSTIKSHESVPLKIEKLSRGFIEFGLNNPEYYEIMFLIHPGSMSRYPAENYRRARRPVDMLISILNEGVEAGHLSVKDSKLTAHAMWSSLHGAITAMLTGRMDVSIDQERFIDLIIYHVMKAITSESYSNGTG